MTDTAETTEHETHEPVHAPALTTSTRPIDAIVVKNRIRKDLGDLAPLKASLRLHGMLNPITISPVDDQLLAGERRLEAARELGWAEVPVRVAVTLADFRQAVQIERDENACRLDLNASEAVAMTRRIVELERPRAERTSLRNLNNQEPKRQQNTSDQVGHSTDDEPDETDRAGRVADIAAEATGYGRETLRKAGQVVDATEHDDPEIAALAREAQAEMDETGKVDPAHRKVTEALDANRRRDLDRRLDQLALELMADLDDPERAALLQERAVIDAELGLIRCPGCAKTWDISGPRARGPKWWQENPDGVCWSCRGDQTPVDEIEGGAGDREAPDPTATAGDVPPPSTPDGAEAGDVAAREGASVDDHGGDDVLSSPTSAPPNETINLTGPVQLLTTHAARIVEVDVTLLDPTEARAWADQMRTVVDQLNGFIANVELCLT